MQSTYVRARTRAYIHTHTHTLTGTYAGVCSRVVGCGWSVICFVYTRFAERMREREHNRTEVLDRTDRQWRAETERTGFGDK